MKTDIILNRRGFKNHEVNEKAADIHAAIFKECDGNESLIIKELYHTINDLGERAASSMNFFIQYIADRLSLILNNYKKTV